MGAHLRRYNASRVATVERLRALHALKCTPYSAEHEPLLQRLWAVAFPGVRYPEGRVSEDWLHLGFQGPDPASDFRGMGVLGLSNLVYFGEQYPDVFQRLVSAQGKRDYPLACAGINVTMMLLELLRMREVGAPALVLSRPPFSADWDSDMLTFFCHMFYRERPFEDMYCFALRALDRIFVSTDADCADFPSVVAALRSRLREALVQRPLSFREFKRLVCAAGADGCDSISAHSRDSTASCASFYSNASSAETTSRPPMLPPGLQRDAFAEAAGVVSATLSESVGAAREQLTASLRGFGGMFNGKPRNVRVPVRGVFSRY